MIITNQPESGNVLSRKALREQLLSYKQKSTGKALRIFLGDYTLFLIGNAILFLDSLSIGWLGSILIWIAITRLFIVGHDACHGSFTDSRRLNKIIGRLAFLPTLTPYRWWDVGHNIAHHTYTNLVGKEQVWIPLSVSEYLSLNSVERFIYRVYRSHLGAGLYYLTYLWWNHLYFPSHRRFANVSGKFLMDSILPTCFLLFWLAILGYLAHTTEHNVWLVFFLGWVFPFALWNMTMGFVIYVHHTHPQIRWYKDEASWVKASPYITTSVHIRFPDWISALLHHIMEHPAHHLDMNIPLYNLKAAQRKLEEIVPSYLIIQDFSWDWFKGCANVCKLYDFENGCWSPFPTGG